MVLLVREGLHLITRPQEVHVHAHEVIVNPSTVKGKETHHQYHVPHLAKHLQGGPLDSLIAEDQEDGKGEQDSSVGNVPEHDPKEEGECHCSHDRRVDLLVTRNAVRVRDLLGHHCVAVGIEGSRWVTELDLVQGRRRHHLSQASAQHLYLLLRHVQLPTDDLLPQLELIQSLIDNFLLPQEDPPALQVPYVLNLMQEHLHLLLIQLNIINDLIELFLKLFQAESNVVLYLVE